MHEQPHIQQLLEQRYYLRDETGKLLENDPKQMYHRVATHVAKAELENQEYWKEKFYELMVENKFMPNTPLLANAGKEQGYFSACNTLSIEDSIESIFSTLEQGAKIFKFGGGLGISFSNLREKGALVKSTRNHSTGPIAFMHLYNQMAQSVTQGGIRMGGILGVLSIDHPDIEEFIGCKDDGISLTNFNISVSIPDEFMGKIAKNEDWDLISPTTKKIVKTVKAKDLWNKICEHAWKTGEPGIIFIDTVNRGHPYLPKYNHTIEALNLCGEIPLEANESCIISSINLMEYLCNEISILDVPSKIVFNWKRLEEDIPTMVRFLDNMIDVNTYPIKEVEIATKKSRKIGLGIMGWADVLLKLQIPYDSPKAIYLAEELMSFIREHTLNASECLALERGNFPNWEESIYNSPMRNATHLTCPPTGSVSRICGVSSGIEPIFSWKTHHKLVDIEYTEEHWAWKEWADKHFMFDECPEYLKTAGEISWEGHLKMQAAFQKYVNNSISKTVNAPENAAVDDIKTIFMRAYKYELKSITVYRDNSRSNQPLNKIEPLPLPPLTEENNLLKRQFPETYEEPEYRKRGPVTVGVTHKVDTGNGKIYITINYSEYHAEPVEVFIRLGHLSTPIEAGLAEWSGRLISLLLKHNVKLDELVRQGNKVYGDATFWYNRKSFSSFPKLISHLLGYTFEEALDMAELDFDAFLENGSDYIEEAEPVEGAGYCYNCSTYSMIKEGGCECCTNCGYEICG